MRARSEHLIIEGNFAPARSGRALQISARLLGLMLCVVMVGALAVYGVKVHFEDAINQVARNTRDLNEQNKELQVRLNHSCSYKNVEAAAARVPHLHMPKTVIEVASRERPALPLPPPDRREFLRVYGY